MLVPSTEKLPFHVTSTVLSLDPRTFSPPACTWSVQLAGAPPFGNTGVADGVMTTITVGSNPGHFGPL
jgi:hypothetical protein